MRVFGGAFLIMLSFTSPLLNVIHKYYHCVRSPLLTLRDVHLAHMGTICALHSGHFGVTTTDIAKYVRTQRKNCSVCLRSTNMRYNVRFGYTFGLMGRKGDFFSKVFIDPIFDVKIRYGYGPKAVVNHPLLMVMDQLTYAVQLLIMKDKTRGSIRKALIQFMERSGVQIREIIADAGQQFQLRNGEKLLPGVLLTTLNPRFQNQDLLERKVKQVKQYFQAVLHFSEQEIMRAALYLVDALSLIDQCCNVINSVPYSLDQSNLILSPDYFMRPYRHLLQQSESISNPAFCNNREVVTEKDHLWSDLYNYTEFCQQTRDQIIQIKTHRFKQKVRKSTLDLEPRKGDICFVISEKDKKGKLCRIISIQKLKATVFMADSKQLKIYPLTHLNVMLAERDDVEDEDEEDRSRDPTSKTDSKTRDSSYQDSSSAVSQ